MRFDFGRNWAEFSRRALTPERVAQARADFAALLEGVELAGKTFLDVGFGQGLSLLAAAAAGARAVGCDVDPTCARVLARNARFFPEVAAADVDVVVGSILDADVQDELRALTGGGGGFDTVHAWGVLHHTGDLRRAIHAAAALVLPHGHLVLAVYNRHWSSPAWHAVKRLYNVLPGALRPLLVALLYPIIWVAKLAVTRRDPARQERGMDFYYNVVDWVGGYPYEYATAPEIEAMVRGLGFECLRRRPARVPTGCNEFVFRKVPA